MTHEELVEAVAREFYGRTHSNPWPIASKAARSLHIDAARGVLALIAEQTKEATEKMILAMRLADPSPDEDHRDDNSWWRAQYRAAIHASALWPKETGK